MNKYLLKIRPLDLFFFGQESKYRKKKDENGKVSVEADYFQVSSFFPQQTTILGMLRYWILMENNQIPIKDKALASSLIGDTSFDVTNRKLDFKKINQISPVAIYKNDKIYLPNPFDFNLKKEKQCDTDSKAMPEEFDFPTNLSVKHNLNKQANESLLFSKEYKEKQGLSHFLINPIDTKDFLFYTIDDVYANKEVDYVFEKIEKIGITKKQEDKAFYKQRLFKFKDKSAGFVCWVEMDIDGLDGKKFVIPMGAEKSLFEISFSKQTTVLETSLNAFDTNEKKLVMISDTYTQLTPQDYLFSINQSIPFRYIASKVIENGKYGSLNNKDGVIRSQKKYNLYQRGSVFYFDDYKQKKAFIEKMLSSETEKNFNKIGYNYIIKNT